MDATEYEQRRPIIPDIDGRANLSNYSRPIAAIHSYTGYHITGYHCTYTCVCEQVCLVGPSSSIDRRRLKSLR